MEKSAFLDLCGKKGYSPKEIRIFERASGFSEGVFLDKKNSFGKGCFEHCLSMGVFLAEAKMEFEVVCAGLLYGVEKFIPALELEEVFGAEITSLVFGQIQLKEIRKSNKIFQADVLRRFLLTVLEDVRIIFVKFADKLDDLKSLGGLEEKSQKNIAGEVMEVYVPLASRLGSEFFRKKLEDSSFRIINPRKYEEIENFFEESKEERESFVEGFIFLIKKLVEGKINLVRIKGRDKAIYSIYRKILESDKSLEEQRDHFAIRIIVDSVEDCYMALGIIHENFEPVEGSLKDYIASPKENGYQSLHTVVRVKDKLVEIQIRTLKMDDYAEEGGASHWGYKKLKSDFNFEKKIGWIKALLQGEDSCDPELLKIIKQNVLGDKIFCYTPKGDAFELPEGASILDFAYAVHMEIGHTAVGGRINGVFTNLKKTLSNGDVVEIVTNKFQRPKREWLGFVVSSKARDGIRKGIKKYEGIPAPKSIHYEKSFRCDFDNVAECELFPNSKAVVAHCCLPVPPEEIIGVMKTRGSFSIHRKDCEKILNVKKFVPVSWKETFNRPLHLKVFASDRSGILADTLNTISRGGFVVREAKIKSLGSGKSECSFLFVPRELEEVINLIERVKKVRDVERIYFE